MIKLGFDARMIAHSGIGTYIRSLLNEFGGEEKLDLTLYGKLEKIAHLPAKKISASFPIYSIREQLLFPWLLEKNDEKNLHSPHYNAPLGFKGNLVVTVHDLIHLRYPPSKVAYFYARTMLTAVCKKAKKIIAVSEATKKDLVEMLGVNEKKIKVIYHGAGLYPPPFSSPYSREENERRDYLLYVGMLKPHKNIQFLIEAFLRAKKRIKELKLVLAGKDFMPEITAQYKNEENLHFLGEVSQERLAQLYRKARLFVLPSLYEGFGFPILEAMSFGVPVLCSNVASLPEVAGEAALYFDPSDSIGLAQKICKLWESRSLREDLIKKGFEQVKKFSWKKCAEETIQVYEECFA